MRWSVLLYMVRSTWCTLSPVEGCRETLTSQHKLDVLLHEGLRSLPVLQSIMRGERSQSTRWNATCSTRIQTYLSHSRATMAHWTMH